MFVIYGSRTLRIKKYVDNHVKCEECGSYTHIFKVYRDYFHVFFIPLFPHGMKQVTSYCGQCGCSLNGQKRDLYLEQTRTPLYMYSGILLGIALIAWLVIMNIETQKLKQEYIANPAVNDVYLINDKEAGGYYFMKIKDIQEDSVFLVMNAYVYSKFVSRFQKDDYFNLYNSFSVQKGKLQELLDEGTINSVERDYKPNSRFNNEKSVEIME